MVGRPVSVTQGGRYIVLTVRVPSCLPAAVLCLSLAAVSGCGAIKGMAVNSVADMLSSGSGDTFTGDEDIELIRARFPSP